MISGDFVPFFTTMAGVGATLFGLIFVVISIRPEVTRSETTSLIRQAQVASSYSALLNPLVISLIAILPRETIDMMTIIMSTLGLISTLIMAIFLLRDSRGEVKKLPHVFFLLVGLVMFSFELFYGIQLASAPGDSSALHNLAILLVLIYLYGIARAWDLVGARQFHIQDVLSPLTSKGREQNPTEEPHVEAQQGSPRQGN
ncbi:MAG TPA: hypothetical protein VKR06_15325 [Ktedonosporobacter sp.]|nr:hypothetical protein [Ktedonosporobacter sp.]